MATEDVLKIVKKLERITAGEKSEDGALDLLKKLKSMNLSIELLQKTRIGMTINELRKKTENEELSSFAKSMIKAWKKLLDGKAAKNGGKGDALPRSDSVTASNSSQDTQGDASEGSGSSRPPEPSGQTRFPPIQGDDSYRQKCREMLLNALKWTDLPDGTHDPEVIAEKIEEKLFDVHRSTNDKYKAALRSRVFNLRDKKNLDLRLNILTGVVSPERFAVMTSEEMASPDMKKEREKFTKDAIEEHQLSTESGTPTDMFKCGKCQKKNCTYTQIQTRSADEPMTTFVYCRECGNRWKFC